MKTSLRRWAILAALWVAPMTWSLTAPTWAQPPTPSPTPAVESGPKTARDGLAWKIASFPLRLTTAVVGLGLGAAQGAYEGVVLAESRVAEHTFGRSERHVTLIPVGVAGMALAAPIGVIGGAPSAAKAGAQEGWRWWDRY